MLIKKKVLTVTLFWKNPVLKEKKMSKIIRMIFRNFAFILYHSYLQVKVWFQNRRTKHKRIRSEDGSSDHEGDSSHNMSHDMDSDVSDDVDVSDDEICVMSHQ